MLIYYGLHSALLLALAAPRSHWTRGVIYRFFLLAIFVFVAFRFEVGCDWTGYYNRFLVWQSKDLEAALENREPGFSLLTYYVHELGLSYPYMNIFSAVMFFAGLHAFARTQRDPLAILVLCFPILILNMPMSAIRQGAAIGAMCVAFIHFSRAHVTRYVLWTIIAALFHSASLVFLALTPIAQGKYSRSRIALSMVLSVPMLAVAASTESGELAVTRYVEGGQDAAGAVFRAGLLFLSGLAFLIYLRKPWRQQMQSDFKLAAIGSFMMLAPLVLLPVSSVIGDRIGYFLWPIQAAIFARVPYLLRGSRGQLIYMVPFFVSTAAFLVWTQMSWHFQECYIPYQIALP